MGLLAVSAQADSEPHGAAPRSKELQKKHRSWAGTQRENMGIHLGKHRPGSGGRVALQRQFFTLGPDLEATFLLKNDCAEHVMDNHLNPERGRRKAVLISAPEILGTGFLVLQALHLP